MALVIALLILLGLTILATSLLMTVNTEGKIASHQLQDTQALAIAEAGVNEGMIRIRTGEVPDNMNKRMVTLVYEAPAGSIPVSGADTTSLPTVQAGNYLGYAGARKQLAQGSTTDLQVLTIRYKTIVTPGSPPDTQIARWDDTKNPKLNTATGSVVFQVVSTGRKGNASRSVVAEVTRARFNIFVRAAIAAKVDIEFKGNINVCGHDHRADTPVYTEPPLCDGGVPPAGWWQYAGHSTCFPGGWSEGTVTKSGAAEVVGDPDWMSEKQTGFYSGPWDALGMSQIDFWPWVGPAAPVPVEAPDGIVYFDNNGTPQDQSGDYSFMGGDGEGFLYCDGNLRINGNMTYRGLIYCEGDLEVNGNLWLLGGLVCKGQSVVKVANGSAVLLYSAEAIQQSMSKYGANIRLLTWREF
jgi:Tfp pilus assembly protein PilX